MFFSSVSLNLYGFGFACGLELFLPAGLPPLKPFLAPLSRPPEPLLAGRPKLPPFPPSLLPNGLLTAGLPDEGLSNDLSEEPYDALLPEGPKLLPSPFP